MFRLPASDFWMGPLRSLKPHASRENEPETLVEISSLFTVNIGEFRSLLIGSVDARRVSQQPNRQCAATRKSNIPPSRNEPRLSGPPREGGEQPLHHSRIGKSGLAARVAIRSDPRIVWKIAIAANQTGRTGCSGRECAPRSADRRGNAEWGIAWRQETKPCGDSEAIDRSSACGHGLDVHIGRPRSVPRMDGRFGYRYSRRTDTSRKGVERNPLDPDERTAVIARLRK